MGRDGLMLRVDRGPKDVFMALPTKRLALHSLNRRSISTRGLNPGTDQGVPAVSTTNQTRDVTPRTPDRQIVDIIFSSLIDLILLFDREVKFV